MTEIRVTSVCDRASAGSNVTHGTAAHVPHSPFNRALRLFRVLEKPGLQVFFLYVRKLFKMFKIKIQASGIHFTPVMCRIQLARLIWPVLTIVLHAASLTSALLLLERCRGAENMSLGVFWVEESYGALRILISACHMEEYHGCAVEG